MKQIGICVLSLAGLCLSAFAQAPELKFIADTIVVQADGKYEADPDIATVTFNISSQEKEMKRAYDAATQSVQRIVAVAEKNSLKREDISTGVLSITPVFEGDRKKRARSYIVQGRIVLRIRDFSKVGSILDDSVEDGVADFRSLTYSLADEEAAKQKAVAEAMQHAVGRAAVALEQKGQKLGALRYMSLDVKQLVGVARLENFGVAMEAVEVESGRSSFGMRKSPLPLPPPVTPEKTAVLASVQCAFQIQ